MTLCFSYHRDAETFVMKAFSRDTQCCHHSTERKVKLNPIEEITQTYFGPHQSCQSTTRLVSRQALVISSISDLSPAPGLSWHPPVWSQGIRSSQQQGVCSLCVVGSGGTRLQRTVLTRWGYMEYWRYTGVPQLSNIVRCKTIGRKYLCVCQRNFLDLDLFYVYLVKSLVKHDSENDKLYLNWRNSQ